PRAGLPGLLLVSPSILLIGVFVYGMIGWNTQLALSDKHAPVQDGSFVGLTNFAELWQEARWPAAVVNAVVFTVVFVGGALLLGWLLGLLLDKGIRGEAVFRTLRSEEHTSELQSRFDLVCRLLLEKKNKKIERYIL